MVDCTLLVLNFRTPELSLRAMADARRSAGDNLVVEELFVDNASGDDSVRLLRNGRPAARVIEAPSNDGFAAGVNLGLREAQGRHVLVLNSDAFCANHAAERLVAHLDSHPEAAIAAPSQLNTDGTPQLNAFRRFPNALTVFLDYCFPLSFVLYGTRWHPYQLPAAAPDAEPRQIAHAMGAALMVRKVAPASSGALDERYFMYLEETEWEQRLVAAGWQIHLVPSAEVMHIGGGSTGDHAFASKAYIDSLERFHRGRRVVRWAALTGCAITLVVAGAAHTVRPKDPRFGPMLEGCRKAWRQLRSRRWRAWPQDRDPPLEVRHRANS